MPCISAASILAKDHRDRIMREYAREHPHYGWHTNVGYGTPEHLEALRVHGPCPLHRRSFAPGGAGGAAVLGRSAERLGLELVDIDPGEALGGFRIGRQAALLVRSAR